MLNLNLLRQNELSLITMNCKLARILPLVLVLELSGCATGEITQNSQYHLINASPTGNAHSIEIKKYYYSLPFIEGAEETDEWSTVGDKFHNHLDNILSNMDKFQRNQRDSGKPFKLLIFVHGGLNTLEESIKRAGDQYDKMLEEGIYPVFINWRSGPFTTYFDHLFRIRDGEAKPKKAIATSPFYFFTDLLGIFSELPEAWVEQGTASVTDTVARNDSATEGMIVKDSDVKVLYSENIPRSTLDSTIKGSVWTITSPAKLLTTSGAYSFGKPAWDIMVRRSRELLIRSCEFYDDERGCNKPTEASVDSASILKSYGVKSRKELENSNAKELVCKTGSRKPICSGALSVFMKKLIETKCPGSNNNESCPDNITLIGHSMGAIVASDLLRYFPHVKFDNIVYMGAAVSSRDALSSLAPYMQKHINTKFYNLSLHPHAEDTETNFGGFVPNGSLLTWIDSMYGLPENEIDKTFGQWLNARQTTRLIPVGVADRFHFRVFGFSDDEPKKHGEFDDTDFKVKYWQPEFWGVEQYSE